MSLTLRVLPGELTIVRLPAASAMPSWLAISAQPLTSVTVTDKEVSIICASALVPEGVTAATGYRAIRVEDKLEFSAVGILASLLNPLAEAGVNILSVSTFDTDYLLVPGEKLKTSLDALQKRFQIVED